MENLFSGNLVVVTGAGSGIGQAAAFLYAQQGAKVVVSDINEAGGNETVGMIKNVGRETLFIKTDVSDAAQGKTLADETINLYGSLDIAFNNAGISGEMSLVADMSIAGWLEVIDVKKLLRNF